MTTLIKGHFVVTGPDIEPTRFKTRRETKDWCVAHYPGSPIKEIIDLRSDFMSAAPAWWRPRGARGAPRPGKSRQRRANERNPRKAISYARSISA
jgi:hypothetical protein